MYVLSIPLRSMRSGTVHGALEYISNLDSWLSVNARGQRRETIQSADSPGYAGTDCTAFFRLNLVCPSAASNHAIPSAYPIITPAVTNCRISTNKTE